VNFPRRLIVLPTLAAATITLAACGSDAKQPAGTNAPTETTMAPHDTTMTSDTMAPHDTTMTSDTMVPHDTMAPHDTMMTETTGG